MNGLPTYPFLRILIPSILGILVQYYFSFPWQYLALSFFLFIILWFVYQFVFSAQLKLKLSLVSFISLQAMLFIWGALLIPIHKYHQSPIFFSEQKNTSHVLATIVEPPQLKEKTIKCLAEIKGLWQNDKMTNSKQLVFLYFYKNDQSTTFALGDVIIVANHFQKLQSSGNPGAFDYAAYCARKNIFEQAFLSSSAYKKVDSNQLSFFQKHSKNVLGILEKNFPNHENQGIAKALLLGYRQDIDPELYQAYANTGLVHLIAISGLHMGMFYFLTLWLLGNIPLFSKRKKMAIIISIALMWLFALLTTFPPSAMRAVLMFSLLGIGELLNKKSFSFNTILASAFLLLCYNPFFLFEIGFQLSYLAVLGILFFYQKFCNLWPTKNKILLFVRNLFALSLSAQMLTFPLSIYYFHQFPLLFLISNLVAVPLVSVIIYGELFLVIFALFTPLANIIAKLLNMLIHLLDQFILFVNKLSWARWQHLFLDIWDVLIIYLVLFFIMQFLATKKKKFLIVLSSFILLLSMHTFFRTFKSNQKSNFVVFNHTHPLCAIYTNGKSNIFPMHDSLSEKSEKFIVEPAQYFFHTSFYNKALCPYSNKNNAIDFWEIKGKRIIRILHQKDLSIKNNLHCDYLILSDKYLQLASLLKFIEPKEIIIDANIPLWKIEKLKKELMPLALPLHIVSLEGAKIISL